MADERILVESYNLGNMLKTYRPSVPMLQRSYSWERPNWEDLWSDLTDAFARYRDENFTYFMGTVVFENDDEYRILDGQQRIATLTILLRALITALKTRDPDAGRDAEGEAILRRRPGKDPTYFLTLNQYDGSFFQRLIQDGQPRKAEIKSHKLIASALSFFSSKIEEKASVDVDGFEEWLGEFYRFVLDRVQFACVTSPSRYSFDVFRVLNDRGKGLSQLDLFRTMILQRASSADRDRIAAEWSRVLDLEEPARPDDLLRYYWVTRKGDVKARSLFRDIDADVKQKVISASDLVEELFFYADFYGDICSAKSASKKMSKSLSDILNLGAKQIYPVLLASYWANGTGKVGITEIEEIAELACNLFVRHNVVVGLETHKLEAVLYDAARLIRANGGLEAAKGLIRDYAAKSVPDDLFAERFANVSVDRHEIAKYLLREIESIGRDTSEIEIIRHGAIHLEHIYPQTPKPEDRWDEHDEWVYRLGNLTLLSGRKNSGLKNRVFKDKAETYRASEVQMTQRVGTLSDWTPKAVALRQAGWAPLALQRWRI